MNILYIFMFKVKNLTSSCRRKVNLSSRLKFCNKQGSEQFQIQIYLNRIRLREKVGFISKHVNKEHSFRISSILTVFYCQIKFSD